MKLNQNYLDYPVFSNKMEKFIMTSKSSLCVKYLTKLVTDFPRFKDELECPRLIGVDPVAKGVTHLQYNKVQIFCPNGLNIADRVPMKPGKMISTILTAFSKIMSLTYTQGEIEEFSYELCSFLEGDSLLQVISGADITKYYNVNNNVGNCNTLGKSCMRYEKCSKYFKIYEDNTKMLVLFEDDSKKRIVARAIIWEIDGKTILDRRYFASNNQNQQLIDYAKSKGWYYKARNCAGDASYYYGPEDKYFKEKKMRFEIDVELQMYRYLPYMDTIRYTNSAMNKLSNEPYPSGRTIDGQYGYFPDMCIDVYGNEISRDKALFSPGYGFILKSNTVLCQDGKYYDTRDVVIIENIKYYKKNINVRYDFTTRSYIKMD